MMYHKGIASEGKQAIRIHRQQPAMEAQQTCSYKAPETGGTAVSGTLTQPVRHYNNK